MSKEHPQSTPGHAEPLPGQAEEADHSVEEETPLGWDQAPKGSDQQTPHRHPRQAGLGGTTADEESLTDAQSSGTDSEDD